MIADGEPLVVGEQRGSGRKSLPTLVAWWREA